jgi:hypothetical protein
MHRGAIHVNRVVAALAELLARMVLEMSNQVSAFHALPFSSSRITSGSEAPSWSERPIRFEYQRHSFLLKAMVRHPVLRNTSRR